MPSQPRNQNPLLRRRARDLRHTQNDIEAFVWASLRGGQLRGFKFRRQHPIGSYVVDFYCAAAALVIELDGATHAGREEYDEQRQAWLESQGLLVLRFTNARVRESFAEFLQVLEETCLARTRTDDPPQQ